MRKITKIIAALFVFIFLLSSQAALALPFISAFADDSIAGVGTVLRAENFEAFDRVNFALTSPAGNTVDLESYADDEGKAELALKGVNTVKAGKYYFRAYTSDQSTNLVSFDIYPDAVDLKKSFFELNRKNISANSSDEARIDVYLVDKHNNPIAFHEVQLVSKRAGDTFVLYSRNAYTDSNGRISYGVRSKSHGRSDIYVYDATSRQFLPKAISIYFQDPSVPALGGDFAIFENNEKFDSEQSFSILALGEEEFAFPDFPSKVVVGEPLSFTLEVRDMDENPVQDYAGTVHFSVPGANVGDVVLPQDYTFSPEDQGTHTFPLSLQFQKEGTYKLLAQDIDNEDMLAEQIVVVGSGESSSSFSGSAFSGIEITQPGSGSYSNPSQLIQGKASPGLAIKIYDNDKEMASVNTDIKGDFSYTTAPLSEGEHTVYAVSISSDGAIVGVSKDVTFNIDVSAPTVAGISFDPESGINPGQSVKLRLEATESLSQVLVSFQGSNISLNQNAVNPLVYEGMLQAPQSFGSYPVSLTLVDSLGNQTEVSDAAKMIVGSLDGEAFVSQIPQIEAHPSDSRVTLIWEKATSTLPIQNYRVYYGISPDLLNHIVDTHDAATSWYVPNLENGREYYFAVTAVDEKGNESALLSDVVSAAPFLTDVSEPVFEPFPDDNFVDKDVVTESPKVQGDTGPEHWFIVLLSILAGNFVFKRRVN